MCVEQNHYKEEFSKKYGKDHVLDLNHVSGSTLEERFGNIPVNERIKLLIMWVDRGIRSDHWGQVFPDLLAERFPNAECLLLEQNYSLPHETAQNALSEFFKHNWVSGLKHVVIEDRQTGFQFDNEFAKKSLPFPSGIQEESRGSTGSVLGMEKQCTDFIKNRKELYDYEGDDDQLYERLEQRIAELEETIHAHSEKAAQEILQAAITSHSSRTFMQYHRYAQIPIDVYSCYRDTVCAFYK